MFKKRHQQFRENENSPPTGLEKLKESTLRASNRRLLASAREYEIKTGKPINMEFVCAVFGPRLAAHNVLASETACLAAYLHHMDAFDEYSIGLYGDTRFSGAVSHQGMTPMVNEFAKHDKYKLFRKMEEAIFYPRTAPYVLQLLLTHDTLNKNGNRRLVQQSFAALVIGVLKHLIDGMDFATMTFSYQYLDVKNGGIRLALKDWNRVAKALGEQYLCPKKKKMVPTARFWKAVTWLKDKQVIKSETISVKTVDGEYKAVPSFKSISKDFLIALGLRMDRLDELKVLSIKRTTERIAKRIKDLTTTHFKPLERLQATARHIQALKDKGIKVARAIHSSLKIPIILEFDVSDAFITNSS